MVSLATFTAYEELEPIIAQLGCEHPDDLRRDLACLLAYHSCRDGSFAQAYAYADLMECFRVDIWALPLPYVLAHPITAFRIWRGKRKPAQEPRE